MLNFCRRRPDFILSGVSNYPKIATALACLALISPPETKAVEPTFSGSLTVREIYDTNIFIQDEAPLALGQTTAALPANADAFITDLGLSLALAWKKDPALQLDASYAPETFLYSRYQNENHTDHRLSANATGLNGAWWYELKSGWLSTAGPEESPIFNRQGGSPPVGSEPVRSRRAQDIYKANGHLTRDFKPGFIRGVFVLSDQDFHTVHRSTPGYANYVDRGEWSAGAEFGWKIQAAYSLVAAVRVGRQHQDDLLGIPLNYTNTLTRWLFGAEGKVNSTLKFTVLMGPDVRHYGSSVRPGFNRHQTDTYFEGGTTWTPTKTDQLTLSGRRYLWISSGAHGAYVDGLYDLSWKHSFAPAWTVVTGLNLHTAATGRYNPTTPRDDSIWAVNCVLTHVINPKTKLDLGFAHDWSISQVPNTPGREYHRQIYTCGCSRAW